MLVLLVCVGCKRKEEKKTYTLSELISQVEKVPAKEERVLANTGTADENGFYSIDMPRSAKDLVYLDSLNSRLYWTSVIMEQENIKDFKENVPKELLWNTVAMEIAFNYGSTSPFTESADGKYTQAALTDFNAFVTSCFKLRNSPDISEMGEGFSISGGIVKLEYQDPKDNPLGFVMTDYKQDGDIWYVKGEIMSKEKSPFIKGVFALEKNEDGAMVPFKIVSFERE